MFAVPLSIPQRYSALRDMPRKSIHARLMLLNHFAKLMVSSWKLFSIQNIRVGQLGRMGGREGGGRRGSNASQSG